MESNAQVSQKSIWCIYHPVWNQRINQCWTKKEKNSLDKLLSEMSLGYGSYLDNCEYVMCVII